MAPKSKGLSGVAIAMIGAGALAVYSAIKGSSPIDELRSIVTGKKPEPLSKTSGGAPLYTPTPAGGGFGNAPPAYTPHPAGSGSLRGLVPYVAAQSQYIQSTWGLEVGGFATSGHVANSDHYTGHALDAMTSSLATGNAIVAHYQSDPKIKYIIWQRRIWFPGRGWNAYHGTNPHTNHVHLSFHN